MKEDHESEARVMPGSSSSPFTRVRVSYRVKCKDRQGWEASHPHDWDPIFVYLRVTVTSADDWCLKVFRSTKTSDRSQSRALSWSQLRGTPPPALGPAKLLPRSESILHFIQAAFSANILRIMGRHDGMCLYSCRRWCGAERAGIHK